RADNGKAAQRMPPASDDLPSCAAADPLTELSETIADLRDAGAEYVRVSLDGVRSGARRIAINLLLKAAAGCALLTLVLTGVVLALVGAAQLVSSALHVSSAAGYFLVGLAAVAIPVAAIAIYVSMLHRKRLKDAKAKYAARDTCRSD